MIRAHLRIAIISGLMLTLAAIWLLEKTRVWASAAPQNRLTAVRAQLSDTVSVHAARRGFPYVNLSDGHELLTPFDGDTAASQLSAAQANGLSPLAMTAADLDEDGVADLICSYDSPQGAFIAVYRGNVDAVYPHTAQARQRQAQGTFTDAPFLAPARVFATPLAGELMVAGDVNGDGRQDIVITSRASRALYVMAGDGKGGIHLEKAVALPGAVTALAAGDINFRDGQTDLLVGIGSDSGPRALIFEGRSGAINAEPQEYVLPDAASGFAIGQFDNDPAKDIAIAAGRSLVVIYGQAHQLPENASPRARQATTSRRDFSFNVKSITSGKFADGALSDIGLLADDGAMYVLRVKAEKLNRKAKKRASQWAVEKLAAKAQSNATRLLTAHVSSLPADDLLLLDSAGRQVRLIETGKTKSGATLASQTAPVDLDVEGAAMAALPMRLNVDALDDLVILRQGAAAPTVLTSAPASIFTVTNNGDNGGVDPAPLAGTGTLRQAIVDANATAGADTIQFNIGTGQQTINLAATLPTISEAVTIDATTQSGFGSTPLIELDGAVAGPEAVGFDIEINNVVVRALVINRFEINGIFLVTAPNSIITGCFIGTDATGSSALGNAFEGISLGDSPGCQIGGAAAGAGNVISGNAGPGIALTSGASDCIIQGNLIGTNATGTAAVANMNGGITVSIPGTTIGGTTAGAGNLISGNLGRGILFQGDVAGTLVQGNRIGTNATGASGLPNSAGIGFGDATSNVMMGGTSAGAGNIIAFNTGNGIDCGSSGGHGYAILGNSIFSNGGIGIDINNDGVTMNDPCDIDTGTNALQNFPLITNVIAGATPTVQGTLNTTDSMGNTLFRIEFFKNATCDPSGFGQGQTFIGSTNVTTNGSCDAAINVVLPLALATGDIVTATATDLTNNNTSEFSPCFTVPAAASANLFIEFSGMPNPVTAGNDITYALSVGNTGPDTATNVTVSEAVPANTTFQSISAPPGWNCSTPVMGGTGTITCTKSSVTSGETAMFTVVVHVNPGTPGGTVISATATVSAATSDPDPSNNSGTVMINVEGASCIISCPANVTANSNAAQCGANVNYPQPSATAGCGTVTCTPPSGAFFPSGLTNVTCITSGGPSCSFTVTVIDSTPPTITCPPSITVGTAPGKSFANVDYPIATAIDACGVTNVVCLPPSGSTFPLGASTVNCSARDEANNTANCSFTVTVNDVDAPVIKCPSNITMELPSSQTSSVVTYPLPTVEDNLPGVTVSCVPPSGSIFPLGVTAVVCVAVNATNNRSTCGFSVSLTGGPPSLSIIIPTGKGVLEFGTERPTPVKRKNKNRATGPCAAFTVVNGSFSRLDLTLDSIIRTGGDVDSGHITNASEGDTYSLSIVGANGLETPLDIGDAVTLPLGGQLNFCLRFSPVLPGVAGSNTQLSAPQAIPDLINSRVTFRVAGGTTLAVNVNAIVETALHLINPNNPRKPAIVTFTKSADEFSVTFAVHDANADVSRAKYEFLDAGGAVIAGPFEVDLTQAIRERNLVRGQSFTVTQRFIGASSNPNASAIRVTVFDGETSVTSDTIPLAAEAASVTLQSASSLRFQPVTPPTVRMKSSLP